MMRDVVAPTFIQRKLSEKTDMGLLTDPRAFSVVILVLFGLATVRYAFAGDWGQVIYNGCACGLNIAVTFMFPK